MLDNLHEVCTSEIVEDFLCCSTICRVNLTCRDAILIDNRCNTREHRREDLHSLLVTILMLYFAKEELHSSWITILILLNLSANTKFLLEDTISQILWEVDDVTFSEYHVVLISNGLVKLACCNLLDTSHSLESCLCLA